jgi:hypothetical protein
VEVGNLWIWCLIQCRFSSLQALPRLVPLVQANGARYSIVPEESQGIKRTGYSRVDMDSGGDIHVKVK